MAALGIGFYSFLYLVHSGGFKNDGVVNCSIPEEVNDG